MCSLQVVTFGCRNLGKIAGCVAEISSIPTTKVLWQSTRAMTSLSNFKLRSSGGPNDWPPRNIDHWKCKKTRRWTQNCGVRWYNFDPRASFWMAMLKTLPCFMCFVFQSNWNSHFGAYLWSFWCWKRVLKSKTSICKVLHVFKSFFLEEQKMDPAESSGSFPMKHLKETHNSELVSVKISFGSIKIHDVFHQISGKFPSFLRLGKSQAIQWIQQNPRWASRRWSYQGKCSGRDHLWSNPLRGRPTPQETGLDFRIVVFFFLTNLWDSWLLWKSMKNYLHLRSVVPWDFVGDRRTNCLS